MFVISAGDWIKSFDDKSALPSIWLPTDFTKEGVVGRNDSDNSWLVVAGPDKETGMYAIFSLDKSRVKLMYDIEAATLEVSKLWSTNKELFEYQAFCTFVYNTYTRGEALFPALEKVFSKLQNKG